MLSYPARAPCAPASSGRLSSLIRPILPHPTDNGTGVLRSVSLTRRERVGQTVRPRMCTLMPPCVGAACHHRAGGDR
ncbi:hypothetical protein GCM10010244_11910 [Streptomyces coeruleorubidus]|nr:hypothetical protein GCM10010244_11910 [Streptomyces bellus]